MRLELQGNRFKIVLIVNAQSRRVTRRGGYQGGDVYEEIDRWYEGEGLVEGPLGKTVFTFKWGDGWKEWNDDFEKTLNFSTIRTPDIPNFENYIDAVAELLTEQVLSLVNIDTVIPRLRNSPVFPVGKFIERGLVLDPQGQRHLPLD